MNWISIDQERCDGCRLCVVRCPRCFSEQNGVIVGQADIDNCNLCGHCIALCKAQAITHEKMDMSNFPEANPDANFDTETFIQFIRNRRSHRHFKNTAIPRGNLETLIDSCRYAPTGSNLQNVEIMVLQDRDTIKKLSNLTVDVFARFGEQAKKAIEQMKADGGEIPETVLRGKMYGERLQESREAGLDPIFHRSPVVMIFHAPKLSGSPKDDCVIASTTVSLLARTMGIESTYIGLFVTAAKDDPKIRDELQLPRDNEIYSVLIMGYPRLKFSYTVDREPIKTRWE